MRASPENYIQQTVSNRRPLLMWLIAAAGCVGVMSLIIGAPLAMNGGHPLLGLTIYKAFSYACHQIPERSFFLAGHQFAVCARCTGIYAGFTVATLLYPLVRSLKETNAPPRKWLFLGAAPLAIDFTIGYLGIWENTHASRFATGALLGAVAVFYVMPGLMDLSLREWGAKRNRQALAQSDEIARLEVLPNNTATAPSDYSSPHRRI